MFSQLHFSHISHHRLFISSWKWNQSWQAACWPRAPSRRACRGSPHHRYIKACRRRPRVDRGLQKNTHIADDHGKKLPEASVSLKWTVFKLCCPAHLFPNTHVAKAASFSFSWNETCDIHQLVKTKGVESLSKPKEKTLKICLRF